MEEFTDIKNMTTSTPLISVIITAYNYGRFLGKAIESVLSQDFTNFELLILNNASTDNTDEVVQEFLDDKRVRYIANETNIGMIPNYHKGYSLCRASFIHNLSADDFMLPGAFTHMYNTLINNPEIDFVYGKYVFVNKEGMVTQEVRHPGWLPYNHSSRTYELADLLQFDCYISLPTVLMRRAVFERWGQFLKEFVLADYEYFCRLAAMGCKSLFVNQVFAGIRIHGNQASVGGELVKSGKQLDEQLLILEKYFIPESFSLLSGYGAHILHLLSIKIDEFKKHSQNNNALLISMQPRISNIIANAKACDGITLKGYPMVSIIVPTQKRPLMLKRALESIQNQTFSNYEIIVINDAGQDVKDIIEQYNSRGIIKYLCHEKVMGISAARNTALRAAKGKYIAYLDDDDMYYPDHLRVLVNYLECNNYMAAYTDAYRAMETWSGETYTTLSRQLIYSVDFDKEKLLIDNLIPNLCLIHRRDCIEKIGYFDPTFHTHEDWELWIRMSREYDLFHLKVITAEYTQRENNSNKSTQHLADFAYTRELIYKRYNHLVRDKPQILERQARSLSLQRQMAGTNNNGIGMTDLVGTVITLVEAGKLADALTFYDANRSKYTTLPELEKFDELVNQIRTKLR